MDRRLMMKLGLAAAIAGASAMPGPARSSPSISRFKDKRVLVIGSGFAGVSAAIELKAMGAHPIIIEARNRIGGRAHTEVIGNVSIENGATWLHYGHDNPIRAVADRAGIKYRNLDVWTSEVLAGTGRERIALSKLFRDTNASEIIEAVAGERYLQLPRLTAQATNGSGVTVGDVWPKIATALGDRRTAVVARDLIEMRFAGSLDDVSLNAFAEDTRLQPVPHFMPTTEAIVTGGMQKIVEFLAKGLDIELEQSVTKIRWSPNEVIVTTDKKEWRADAAIVTLPLGVIQANPGLFDPVLPDSHAAPMRRMKMGLLGKVGIVFPEVIWPTDIETYLHVDGNPAQTFINLAAYGQGPGFLALGNVASSYLLEAMSDEEASTRIKGQLETVLGMRLPDPVGVKVTRWLTDPFSRGAYGYPGKNATGFEGELLSRPIARNLILAGESYTQRDPHSVQGAYFSGIEAVAKLAALT